MTIYLVYSTVALSETGRSTVEVLVGESIFLYVWCGNGVPNIWTIGQKFFLDKSSDFWTKVPLSTKSDAFYRPVFLMCLIIFSTCCTVYLKLRYRDIVAFRTKNWMAENLVIDSLQTSRFPPWGGKTLSDHFQCPSDAAKTYKGKVPE